MTHGPPDITIVHPWDPWEQGVGGFDTCLDGFLRCAPATWRLELIGLTRDPVRRPPGRWLTAPFCGRLIRFLPALADPQADQVRPVPLSLRFALACRRLGLRARGCVVQYHRFESALAVPALRAGKAVFFVHNHPPAEVRSPYSGVRWRRLPWLHERLLLGQLRGAAAVVAVDPQTPAWVKARLPHLQDHVLYLQQWADPAVFHPGSPSERERARRDLRLRLGADPGVRVVLFVGRLEQQKDPLLALQAFARIRQAGVRLAVAGMGRLERTMRRQARALGVAGRVGFRGPLRRQEMAWLYRGGDVLLCTSAFESGPRTVFEALACGTPAVSTEVGQVAKVLPGEGRAGRLIRERTPRAVARELETVLAWPASYGEALRRAEVVAGYTPQKALAPLFSLYEAWLEREGERDGG